MKKSLWFGLSLLVVLSMLLSACAAPAAPPAARTAGACSSDRGASGGRACHRRAGSDPAAGAHPDRGADSGRRHKDRLLAQHGGRHRRQGHPADGHRLQPVAAEMLRRADLPGQLR